MGGESFNFDALNIDFTQLDAAATPYNGQKAVFYKGFRRKLIKLVKKNLDNIQHNNHIAMQMKLLTQSRHISTHIHT